MTERQLQKERLIRSSTSYPEALITAVSKTAVTLRETDLTVVTRRAIEVVMGWSNLVNDGGNVWIRTFEPNGKKTPNMQEGFRDRLKKAILKIRETSTDTAV